MKRIILTAVITCLHWSMQAQTMEWVKQIGSEKTDRALSVTTDAAGNVYTTGHYQDIVDFDPGAGEAIGTATSSGEAFIVKMGPSGNLVKAWTFGKTTSSHLAVGSSIAVDAAGSIYTAGYFTGNNVDFDPDTAAIYKMSYTSGGNNAFILKLDASGSFEWAKKWKYGKDAGNTTEEGPCMTLDAAGNIYTTGRFKGTVDFDPDTSAFTLPGKGEDGYITKLDASGNFIWAKQLATDTTTSYIHPRSIALDGAGNMYITGSFKGTVDFNPDPVAVSNITSTSLNGFVVKLDASGNFLWVKKLGNNDFPLLEYHRGNAVTADLAGNAYITGSFMGTVAFGSFNLSSAGNSDIFIVKTDPSGNFIWAKQLGSMYDAEEGSRITIDPGGNIYITGTYRGTIDFNPGAGVNNISTNGSIDVFILKLDASGNFIWAKGLGGASAGEHIGAIAVQGNDVYTVGKFLKTVNFDPDGIYNLTAASAGSDYYDIFIHKMNQGATGIHDAGTELNTIIFPNPATKQFSIDLTGTRVNSATVSLFDMEGRIVIRRTIERPVIATVNVEDLPRGIYLVKVQSQDGYAVKKLVIE